MRSARTARRRAINKSRQSLSTKKYKEPSVSFRESFCAAAAGDRELDGDLAARRKPAAASVMSFSFPTFRPRVDLTAADFIRRATRPIHWPGLQWPGTGCVMPDLPVNVDSQVGALRLGDCGLPSSAATSAKRTKYPFMSCKQSYVFLAALFSAATLNTEEL